MLTLFCIGYSSNAANKTKTNYRNAFIFAYSPLNSIVENDSICIEIYDNCLFVTNKTDKTMYIDRSQCFLTNNGASYPMWAKRIDEKKASSAGISYENDAYISIAPNNGTENATLICQIGTKLLDGHWDSTSGSMTDFTEYDKRFLNLVSEMINECANAKNNKLYLGTAHRHLTEDESINNVGASIAYSFNKKTDDWTNIAISTWVCDVIFAPYFISQPKELTGKEKSGFGIKETPRLTIHIKADSPFEFNEDKSPLIVSDWTGDWNKGTFSLKKAAIIERPKIIGGLTAYKKLKELNEKLKTMSPEDAENYVKRGVEKKSWIIFDGKNKDWGKMIYAPKIEKTNQVGK